MRPIGYHNPELAKLLDRLRTTVEPEAEDRAYRDVSDLLRRDQPFAFLYRMVSRQIVHRRVKGLSTPWRADPLNFMEDLRPDDRDRPSRAWRVLLAGSDVSGV